jgi:tetratricopeptide (TPR) repeat protein
MDLEFFRNQLENMPDYDFMMVFRNKLQEYGNDAVELIKVEYEKRKAANPNLELYFPVSYEERVEKNRNKDIRLPSCSTRIHYGLANPSKRLFAFMIDFFLCFIFVLIPLSLGEATDTVSLSQNVSVIAFYFLLAAFLAAQALLLSIKGQTLGKMIMKIRVVKISTGENGGFVTNVLLRFAFNTILRCFPIYGLLDVSMIFGPDNRCMHDHIAGTVVVDLRKSIVAGSTGGRSGRGQYDSPCENNNPKSILLRNIIVALLGSVILVLTALLVIGTNTDDDYDKLAKEKYDNAEYTEAIGYCDKALQKNPKDIAAFSYKGKSLNNLEKFDEAITVLHEAEDLNIADSEIFIQLGCSNYYLGKYNEALRCFTRAADLDQKSSEALLWKAYTYFELGEDDAALVTINIVIEFDPKNAKAHNARGNAYFYKADYGNAIKEYDEAIALKPDYSDVYINKIRLLYEQKKYTECLDYCESTIRLFAGNKDVLWYQGDCYSAREQHEKAITCYEEALKNAPDHDNIAVSIGWEYFHMLNYQKASEYAQKALKLNTENESALELNKELEEAKKPESERIANFIRDNYLYFDKVDHIENKLKEFALKKQVETSDIARFIDSIRYRGDVFTFLLDARYYDEFISGDTSNHIDHKSLDANMEYIRISSFTSGIANEFRDIVANLSEPEERNLIIDLRDNPGGLAYPTNNILDILLPKCITSYMIQRDGQINTYSSNEACVNFKHIYVFVNQNSASSSELLSLGLRKYAGNVTIIGSPTVGKGVGQVTFENKQRKYVLFLVNHYWNVKEKNIMGENIQPDMLVESNNVQDYIDAVSKELK